MFLIRRMILILWIIDEIVFSIKEQLAKLTAPLKGEWRDTIMLLTLLTGG